MSNFGRLSSIYISIVKSFEKFLLKQRNIEEVNNWDKIKSVMFMCHKVEEILNQFELEEKTQFLLKSAKKALSDNADYFNHSYKQLIHSDLGPGNIVFCVNNFELP
jgi:Ser/Thr protein kinase RdoA (MazF antagonist)